MFDNYINFIHSQRRILAKQALSLATIALALAACGPATVSQTVEIIASAPPDITEPYTLTPTQTEILHTPTATLTPTETSVPRPKYATEMRTSADFTTVESLAPIVEDIEGHRVITQSVTLDFAPIQPYEFGGSSEGVTFNCEMGVNCVKRAFVKVEDSKYGIFRYYIMLEVRNPGDTQSGVLVLEITPDIANEGDFKIALNSKLESFNKYSEDGFVIGIDVLTQSKDGKLSTTANTETYKNYPPDVQEMRKTLRFPKELSGVPLLAAGFGKAVI